jgi:hypothetical protein
MGKQQFSGGHVPDDEPNIYCRSVSVLKLGELLRQGCQHTDPKLLRSQRTKSKFADASS